MYNVESGKYYQVVTPTDNKIYYAKIDKINGKLAYFAYYIYNNTYYDCNPKLHMNLNFDYVITEIMFDSIVDKLDDSHPDKKYYIRQQKIKHLLNG